MKKITQIADLEMVPPLRQRSWGWPAVANLTLGAAGCGVYLFGMLFSQKWPIDKQLIPYQVLAPLIVCIGFMLLSIEAGKPLRAYRLLNRLPNSWMSIESLFGTIFILFALASNFYSFFLLTVIAVTAAFMLLLSQGVMLFRAVAVRAWNEKIIPFLFMTSGLMTAGGFVILNTRNISTLEMLPIAIILIICFLNLSIWMYYLFRERGDDFTQAIAFLRRRTLLFLIVGVGHILPILQLLSLLNSESLSLWTPIIGAASGLMLIAGGASQKMGIIIAAGYYRRMVFLGATENKSIDA